MSQGNPNIKDHGFGVHPDHINRNGANKGSKWKKTLLKDLMTADLNQNEIEQFEDLKMRFPSFFNSSDEKNFQLFMEIKQIALVFSNDQKASQRAINAIKDRIEGKTTSNVNIDGDENNIIIFNIPDNGRG